MPRTKVVFENISGIIIVTVANNFELLTAF